MKTVHADAQIVRELLKDTEKEPVLIQGPDELTGVLISVETYELLGRFDETAEVERHAQGGDERLEVTATARSDF